MTPNNPENPPVTGIELIASERARQISEEGWTPEHNDEHRLEEMIEAAAVYMAHASEYCSPLQDVPWPWSDASFKPSKDDPVRDLVKAGALIAAEIERRQRAAHFTTPTEQLSGTDRSMPGKPNEITARSGEPIPPPGFQIALPDDPQLPGAMGWMKGEAFGWEPLTKNVSREEWIIANPAQPLPCFQKGGDEPCAQSQSETLTPLSTSQSKPSSPDTEPTASTDSSPSGSASNAPVAVPSPDQGPEHNPDGLTPEKYGWPKYRLLKESEDPITGDGVISPDKTYWLSLGDGFLPGKCKDRTYRRRVAPEQQARNNALNKLAYEQGGEPRTECPTCAGMNDRVATQGQRIAELTEQVAVLQSQVDNADVNLEQARLIQKGIWRTKVESAEQRIAELERERDEAMAEAGAIRDLVETLLKEAETAINDHDERQHLSLAQWEGRKSVLVGMSAILPTAAADLLKELEFVRKGRKTALAQLAASEKDQERLDWLEANRTAIYPITGDDPKWKVRAFGYHETLRAAIDAAMKEAK